MKIIIVLFILQSISFTSFGFLQYFNKTETEYYDYCTGNENKEPLLQYPVSGCKKVICFTEEVIIER